MHVIQGRGLEADIFTLDDMITLTHHRKDKEKPNLMTMADSKLELPNGECLSFRIT